jgi:F0F1-type ATP synthase membrane subunit b/b'|tara:strand:+ start:595 stop:816 length:222 start_codon:yes stop_codon:yes gene_type:complete
MNDTIKTYLTEAYEGYSKSLTQVDEFLATQEAQLQEAKAHRQTMVSKIEELKEMIGIDDTVEVAENEPEVAPV